MGWSGTLTENSGTNAKTTFTPNTNAEGGYTVSAFTAPKNGVYRFELKGSGGTMGSTEANSDGTFTNANLSGGRGGSTVGYLEMQKGETVYVGAGGTCAAAFVATQNASKLSGVQKANLRFVAGAGGGAGRCYRGADYTQFGEGGNGGGQSGTSGTSNNSTEQNGGKGGSQSSGGAGGTDGGTKGNAGAYGAGGAGTVRIAESYAWGGRGGDGYYGGGSGGCTTAHYSVENMTHSYGFGGGGGSGYVKTAKITVLGKTYTSSTSSGGGASAGSRGSVTVSFAAKTLLPVFFGGTQLERIFFNGTDAQGLIYNGQRIYALAGRLFAAVRRIIAGVGKKGRCCA